MPGIEELLRVEGEQWRSAVDARHEPSAAPRPAARYPWSTPRGRVWTLSIGAVAAAAVVVLAVGISSDSSTGNRTFASHADSGGGLEPEPGAKVAAGAAASSAAGGATAQARTNPGQAPSAGRAPSATSGSTALILTGSLSLTVPGNAAVDRAATRATDIADGAGGRVDADTRNADPKHSATLVLRVPNASLAQVTTQLSALGTVTARNLSTKDVTSQVADVNSRVVSARAAIAALDRLYAKTQSVKDLITVEAALAARQADLESLEAQQRTLAAQTGLATLTVDIDVRAAAPTTHRDHHHTGFLGGLHHGWHAFTTTVRALAAGAGAVLPFGVVLALVGAGLLVVRRRRRRPAS